MNAGPPVGGHRPPPVGSATAGWALGLALVGCLLVGNIVSTVLALRVLAHRRRTGEDNNHGLAIAALAVNAVTVGVLALVAYAAVVFDGVGDPGPSAAAHDALRRVNGDRTVVASLMEMGFDDDCLALSGGSDEEQLTRVVPCDEPHDWEAYEREWVEDAEFPGEKVLERRGKALCQGKAFERFVGLPLRRSGLGVVWVAPTAEEWEYSDRLLICLVTDPAGPRSESLLLSKR
ncbi:septum formation family protein [Nocardioides sp. LML1-1-1.1]|uniref:septum formation family protein n=1 Tax=Nocardioides sp. LML1-1-1.1 TaxID=3135248 RepID=UPI00343AE83E